MFSGGGESSSSSGSTSDILQRWKEIQCSLKQSLIMEDDFTWKLPSPTAQADHQAVLKFIGGVDVSCLKDDQSVACGTIVVLDFETGKVVYHDSAHVRLDVPYIAGFLAFREAPVLLQLLEKMKNNNNPYYPQLVMVDGNGILHPRGFGLACHLGVLENLPTIGIGKKLHCIDGLTEKGVRKCLQEKERSGENFVTLIGRSGRIHGVAMKSTEGSVRPIFISIGHRVSLDTAIKIVQMTCKYRVPEPIRQADKRSRVYVQKPQQLLKQFNNLNLRESSGRVQSGSGELGQSPFQRRGRGRCKYIKQTVSRVEEQKGSGQERGERQSIGRGYRGLGRGRGRGPIVSWKIITSNHDLGESSSQVRSGSGELGQGQFQRRGRGRCVSRGEEEKGSGQERQPIGRGPSYGRGRGRCEGGNICEYVCVKGA